MSQNDPAARSRRICSGAPDDMPHPGYPTHPPYTTPYVWNPSEAPTDPHDEDYSTSFGVAPSDAVPANIITGGRSVGTKRLDPRDEEFLTAHRVSMADLLLVDVDNRVVPAAAGDPHRFVGTFPVALHPEFVAVTLSAGIRGNLQAGGLPAGRADPLR
jgi:hypothetical protein